MPGAQLKHSALTTTVWSGLYHQHFNCTHSSLQEYFWGSVLSNLVFWPLNNLISTQDRTVLSGLKFTRKCTSLSNLRAGSWSLVHCMQEQKPGLVLNLFHMRRFVTAECKMKVGPRLHTWLCTGSSGYSHIGPQLSSPTIYIPWG